MRLITMAICLSVGAYALYGAGKQWGYVRRLRGRIGNRKIKQQKGALLVMGLLLLLGGAWNLWLFVSSK